MYFNKKIVNLKIKYDVFISSKFKNINKKKNERILIPFNSDRFVVIKIGLCGRFTNRKQTPFQ